jgi:hypothetical protein
MHKRIAQSGLAGLWSKLLLLALLFAQLPPTAQACPYVDLGGASAKVHAPTFAGVHADAERDACVAHCLARAEQSQQQTSSGTGLPAAYFPAPLPASFHFHDGASHASDLRRVNATQIHRGFPPLNILHCSYQV